MLIKKKMPKRIFWIMLVVIFLMTGGYISASSAGVLPSDLIISEFVAANKSGLIDEDGDYSDWIEIYNRGASPVNLAGWALTNDPNQPQQWPFPDITLGSNEYLVVFASGKNRRVAGEQGAAILHTNFKLSKDGEFLALHNLLEGRLMDTISSQYPEQFDDVAYGRYDENLSLGYLANPTPGRPNDETLFWAGAVAPVEFSMKRGFYEAPFTVVLVATTPGSTIRYTLDGSEPTQSHGTIFTEPITINSTTMLRAIAFRPNFLLSEVTTHTYIFLDDVANRFGITPDFLANVATQTINTGQGYDAVPAAMGYKGYVEPADDSPTRDEFTKSLKSIPTLSLVMPGQSLADLTAQPQEIEKREEYPVSVELIDPEGHRKEFQINAGVKLQDIPEASESIAKRSLRLFFRGEYGASRLEYPLFTESSVESFDTLLLEAGSNIGLAGQDQANFIRNEWLRASQIEMSGLGAHGTFVHLYLNGEYWGLYNMTERPDADFMASYLGGLKEDWFIANQDGPLANDLGPQADKLNDLFTVLPLLSRLDLGMGSEQSNDLDSVYATTASHFDPANLIDLAILNWYTGWSIDNWYAAVRPQDQVGRGKILIADEQQAVLNSTEQTHQSLINRLVQASMENSEFRVQFADRLYNHLYNNGALTDANAQARWLRFNNMIEPAFTAESIRWVGPNEVPAPIVIGGPLTMQNDVVVAHMSERADSVLGLMREMGYYPSIDPPVFNQEGGLVESGFSLEMSTSSSICSDCTIYYTTDGSDPRLPFTGEVIPTAKAYSAPIKLEATTLIKARVLNGSALSIDSGQRWSALHETTFNVVKEDNRLRITEIMYNPVAGDDYEFVELQNTGSSPVDLANFSLDDGIRFAFLPNTPALAPGGFAVLVSNPEMFAERYPDVAIAGVYDGHLSNKGEKILLRDASGEVMIEIAYNDEYGWPVSADGRGDSLTLINESGNPGDSKNWRASDRLNGSPGE